MKRINRLTITLILGSIVLLATIFIEFTISSSKQSQIKLIEKMLLQEAKSHLNHIVVTRKWNANHGGVYVKKQEGIEPNPYLVDNHIFSDKGEMLVKINPAWMTRQISEISNIEKNYYYKITSLNPLNPDNFPDSFEKEALEYFEKNKNIKTYYEYNTDSNKFDFMGSLIVDNSCLNCHAMQGYKVGDVRGGIRVSIPTNSYDTEIKKINYQSNILSVAVIVITLFVLILIVFLVDTVYKRQQRIESLNIDLQDKIEDIEKIKDNYKKLFDKYDYAINGANDGFWDWDLVENSVYFSPIWKAILGYKDDELENDFEEWKSRVHPEDIDKAYKDILDNHHKLTTNYENIHRLRHKNGSWVWILDRGKTIFDESGNPIRMVGFHTDITTSKELELELLRSQRNLKLAQKIAKVGHWRYELRKRELKCSEEVFSIFELEIPQNYDYSLFKDKIDLEDSYVIEHIKLNAFKSKSKYKIKYKILTKSGPKIVEEQCEFIETNNENIVAIGTIQDITDKELVNKELNQLRAVIEYAPLSIVITDLQGTIEYVNPCFTKVTGYTSAEAIGQNPKVLKSKYTSTNEYEDLWHTIIAKKTWTGTFKNIDKFGKEFWEYAIITPILNDNGELKNFLAIKEEITKEVYLKKEIANKDELMIAQSRHAAMGEMISMIAHQWRQPLTVISMVANNMITDIELEDINSDIFKDYTKDILEQTKYLSNTIEDFRNFFKPNKETEEITLSKIYDDTFGVIGKSLENANINIVKEYDGDLLIITYSRELLQVLINIIKNAKEVLVDKNISDPFIKLSSKIVKDRVVLTINDNAGGIKKDILDKIFDPYFTTKSEQNGTGLGLYISKTIIEKHLKGSLKAYNNSDGAVFEIVLPLSIKVENE